MYVTDESLTTKIRIDLDAITRRHIGLDASPLTAAQMCHTVLAHARRQFSDAVRAARAEGCTWEAIAGALPGGNAWDAPTALWEVLAAGTGYVAWRCPTCAGLILDLGPDINPADVDGHHADCPRHAADVATWQAAWEDDLQ